MQRVDETTKVTKCTKKDRVSEVSSFAGVNFSFFLDGLWVLYANCQDASGDFAQR